MIHIERFLVVSFLILLPISFSASYVPMAILFLLYLIIWSAGLIKYNFPGDFLLYVLLYIWRGITLKINGLKLTKLKEIFDKSGYIIFSNAPVDRKSLSIYLHSLGIVISLITAFGIADRLSKDVGRTEYIIECRGKCSFQVLSRSKVHIYNYETGNAFAYLKREGMLVDSFLPNPGYPVYLKLPPGNYELEGKEPFFVHFRSKGDFLYTGKIQVKKYDITWDRGGKFRGLFSHKLYAAAFYAIVTILFLSAFLFFERIHIIYFLSALLSLLMTTSRAYIPPAFLGILLLLYVKYRRNWKLLLSSALLLALVGLFVVLQLNIPIYRSLTLRLNFWKAGLEIASQNPLFGVGYNNISTYLLPYHMKGLIDNFAHAHNTYITAFAETGIPGLILVLITYIYFTVKFIRDGLSRNDRGKFLSLATGISFLVLMLSGLFETNFDTTVVNLTMGFLMGLSVSRRK